MTWDLVLWRSAKHVGNIDDAGGRGDPAAAAAATQAVRGSEKVEQQGGKRKRS